MVSCPHCGKPLIKHGNYKYHCENARCPVIFVTSSFNGHRKKVAFAISASEDAVRKTHETIRIRIFANQWSAAAAQYLRSSQTLHVNPKPLT